MSVFDNVAYGLRVRKRPEAEVTTRVREALDLVQLGELGTRSASKLSGGQQQRVALARAFVFSPSVLLFDEPLSNLDAKLRAEMRVELKELQRRLDITSVYVTHDLEEALAISDRIVVMRDGVIEQVGTPGEIYDRPRNTFVADFVGSANLIRGRRRTDLERDGLVVIQTTGGALVHGTAAGRPAGTRRCMAVRTDPSPARARAPGRRPSTCGRPGSASACSRAISRSTTSSGTAGSSSCARRRRIRWPRATTSSSAPIRATACCWRSDESADLARSPHRARHDATRARERGGGRAAFGASASGSPPRRAWACRRTTRCTTGRCSRDTLQRLADTGRVSARHRVPPLRARPAGRRPRGLSRGLGAARREERARHER